MSFSCFGPVARIRRSIYKPVLITGKVGRPPTIREAKGRVAYQIEPEGELGAIIYGSLRNFSFRTRQEAITAIKLSPYIYEEAGLKQLAVAGMKIGWLETNKDQPRSQVWLFRAEEGANQKFFECLEVLCFPTIERLMEMVMVIYDTSLRRRVSVP